MQHLISGKIHLVKNDGFQMVPTASLPPRPCKEGLDRSGQSRVGLAECMVFGRSAEPAEWTMETMEMVFFMIFKV